MYTVYYIIYFMPYVYFLLTFHNNWKDLTVIANKMCIQDEISK